MDHETATWLNRIGLILGFFSFWFAAPEFIGEQRLKAMETSLAKLVGKLPLLFLALCLVTVIVVVVFYWGFYQKLFDTVFKKWDIGSHPLIVDLFTVWKLVFGVGSLIYIFYYIYDRFVEPFILSMVSMLANDQRQRQRSLFIGAALFTISTLLEFMATFESAAR